MQVGFYLHLLWHQVLCLFFSILILSFLYYHYQYLNNLKAPRKETFLETEVLIRRKTTVKYVLRIGKKIRTFWEIASKENVKVVTGLDCHNPHLFSEFFKQKEDVINLLSGLNINFVNGNYNPVLSRLQNQKLDIIYKSREGKTLTSYSSYSLSLLNKIFDRIPKVSEAGVVENYILEEINNEINYNGTLHIKKNEIALDEVTHLTEIDAYVKSFKLLRYKKSLESYSETIRVLTSTLNALKEYGVTSEDFVLIKDKLVYERYLILINLIFFFF